MKDKYTYAVARIRAKEMTLLRKNDLERILSSDSLSDSISFLKEKGWGKGDDKDFKELIRSEYRKLWNFISEITEKEIAFELFTSPVDYTNLKTAIKSVVMDRDPEKFLLSNGTLDKQLIYSAIKEKNYDLLPEHMIAVAEDAFEVLLHTNDSQLSDAIIDKALLERMINVGVEAKHEEIYEYAELFVAVANIKTAVRGFKMAKSLNFFKRAMAKCKSLDVDRLALAATKSLSEIYKYLSLTSYNNEVNELKSSMATFEKFCDNKIIKSFKEKSQYDSFTLLPIFTYVLERETEIKSVRMIMICKNGGLDDEAIRERLRDVYA